MDANNNRVGYEHHYSFSVDDDILSLYSYRLVPGYITFLIEIRATFMVKTKDGEDQIIDSERYKFEHSCNHSQIPLTGFLLLEHRLEEYWMTEEEGLELEYKGYDFTEQTLADPKYASRSVIPMVIKIDVCTVQQDGEAIGGAHDRAIRAQDLVPPSTFDRSRPSYDPEAAIFLIELERFRVDQDVKGAAEVVCGICWKEPRIGAQMSVMPCCNRAFHSNCIFRWVLDKNACPYCNTTPELQDL